MKTMKKIFLATICIILIIFVLLGIKYIFPSKIILPEEQVTGLIEVPDWDGESSYVVINDNIPFFTQSDLDLGPFEFYSELDELGRCQIVWGNIGKEFMPTEERGSIGMIKPTGWQTPLPKYDFIDGGYLYNRCHLIGFQLTGENDNIKNLITGTRYFNIEGMLPWENKVASYIRKTENHVLYRVSPDFRGDNLLANGVLIEAYSIADQGRGISFCVYCYNVQPLIEIDYSTGEAYLK